MAWSTTIKYKTRLRARPDDTLITSLKPPDNGMPSSSVPLVTHAGLVTFQHDLKALIGSSPLLRLPLMMRSLAKKRSSPPFTLTLKRHSTTIFSRSSSSSSETSASAGCTPASELADPLSVPDVVIDSPSEAPLRTTPSIGAKILDRFWPEEEGPHPEESHRLSVPSRYPTALAPPPHHRRAPCSSRSVHERPLSEQFPPRTSKEHNSDPLRFPF